MVLDQTQRLGLRKTMYVLLLVAVVIGAVLFFFTGTVATFVRTLVGTPTPTLVTLRATVFNDANSDGKQDPLNVAEHAVSFVDLTLKGPFELTATTDASGELVVSDVLPGTYQVSAALAGNALEVTPNSLEIPNQSTVLEQIAVTSVTRLNGIEGRLVLDTDGDGQANDSGLGGIEMQLRTNEVAIAQAETDDTGAFTMSGIDPGRYTLVAILTGSQRTEYDVTATPEQQVEIKSEVDRLHIELLVRTRSPAALRTTYRLAQASPSAGFLITKAGSDTNEQDTEYVHTLAGGTVHYTITVRPFVASPGSVSNVRVVDQLPSILTPSGVTGGGNIRGGTIEWSLGAVGSDQTITLEYDARVSGSAKEGYYKNTVTVTGDDAEPADDDASVVVMDPDAQAVTTNGNTVTTTTGSTSTTTNGVGSANQSLTPVTGVGAWIAAGLVSAATIAAVAVLVAGYRRTKSPYDRTLQS